MHVNEPNFLNAFFLLLLLLLFLGSNMTRTDYFLRFPPYVHSLFWPNSYLCI